MVVFSSTVHRVSAGKRNPPTKKESAPNAQSAQHPFHGWKGHPFGRMEPPGRPAALADCLSSFKSAWSLSFCPHRTRGVSPSPLLPVALYATVAYPPTRELRLLFELVVALLCTTNTRGSQADRAGGVESAGATGVCAGGEAPEFRVARSAVALYWAYSSCTAARSAIPSPVRGPNRCARGNVD